MKRFFKSALLCSSICGVGCATPTAPVALVDARKAYTAAEVNATRAAPTELHDARIALDAAEATFADHPRAVEVSDRAYIAQRRSELASARAATFIAYEHRDASNLKLQALGAAAATSLRATRQDLSAAELQAQAALVDVHGLRSDLKLSESAAAGLKTDLNEAKTNASGLKSSLTEAETKASGLQTQLAAEKQARRDSEAKLTSTLLAMRDLQSVKEETRGLVITLSGAVLFASGKSALLPAARSALDNVAEALKATPDRAIVVEGHTDSQGSRQLNMALSQRRSEAVRSYLVSRGIADASIRAAGFGPNRPLADNATTDGRANNRRVEIVLAPPPLEAR